MNLSISVWSLALILGSFQAIFLSIVFFSRVKRFGKANLFLGFLLLIFSIILFDHSLRLSELYKAFPSCLYISDALWYLIAPLLWMYFKFRYNDKRMDFRWFHVFHLIPFFYFLYEYRRLPFFSADIKVGILESHIANGSEFPFIVRIYILIMMIQILTYLFIIYFSFHHFTKKYKAQFSSNDIVGLQFSKRIIQFFLFYFLAEFSYTNGRYLFHYQSDFIENWSLVMWTIFLLLLSYSIIIYDPKRIFNAIDKTGEKGKEVALRKIADQLNEKMLNERLFLNQELSLTDLARKLDVSPNQLSQVLNNHLNETFYEYINRFRIKHAVECIDKGLQKKMSLFGIAQMSGFKNKTSFYQYFKKVYDTTPKKYLENKLNQ